MVITRIFGGLGNQMFQYACGRALALRTGNELVLDERDFFAGPGQEPGLHHLNVVSGKVAAGKLPPSKKQRLRYLVWRALKLPPRIVREQGMAFDPKVIALPGDVFLHGYWQSERYFCDFAQRLRQELSVKTPPDKANTALLRQMGAEPAVSLHIRRGDYVTNPKANALHGTCSLAYYKRAAKLIAERMDENPVFYVFSDEPQWAAANLELPFDIRVVDHNSGDRNFEDMRLMSACRHHIVANSSFSWWGAWLNPSESKIVVAPEKWFADPEKSNPDIIPKSWLTVEN
ncbi:alpha-1,2-fucosyltransferase [Hoeflea poritis]|uniref:Alpha-1,2-fucosyltransferase n=1 Tax=Hoeflea poritis TaxID=2993659 RepID=A0ABT4VHT5_9HYPH|nr:alpha-1,2-fucosyltransferase [Hoeflea poritis]MDA4844247.1 alpha-1,2-fucosyltransferase [Hoeflea poritis]